jgi:hypothetical protein
MKKQRKTGAARALEGFGNSGTKMAKALQAAGFEVTRQNLEKLARDKKPLTAHFVPAVSELTNIPKSEMNDQFDWVKARLTRD